MDPPCHLLCQPISCQLIASSLPVSPWCPGHSLFEESSVSGRASLFPSCSFPLSLSPFLPSVRDLLPKQCKFKQSSAAQSQNLTHSPPKSQYALGFFPLIHSLIRPPCSALKTCGMKPINEYQLIFHLHYRYQGVDRWFKNIYLFQWKYPYQGSVNRTGRLSSCS